MRIVHPRLDIAAWLGVRLRLRQAADVVGEPAVTRIVFMFTAFCAFVICHPSTRPPSGSFARPPHAAFIITATVPAPSLTLSVSGSVLVYCEEPTPTLNELHAPRIDSSRRGAAGRA